MLDSLRYGASFIKLALQNRELLRFSASKPLLQDLKGGFSSFTLHRTLDPKPEMRGLMKAVDAFAAEYPSTKPLQIKRAWAGYIDYMPDELPVIDELDDISGLFVAVGFHGNGFGMEPGVGKVLADLIAKGKSDHDLTALKASRF